VSWALAILLLGGAGLALLALLRLATGHRGVDAALAWLVGAGWFAAIAPPLRFALGLPLGRGAALAIALLPPAAWTVRWARRKKRGGTADGPPSLPPPADAGGGAEEEKRRSEGGRWIPRPLAVYAPIALYVVVVAAVVVLHGANSPTFTDDGVRVRAFAPMLAFADAWPPEARAVLSLAGPLPTFVPAFAWLVTGSLDHFHVNYAVLTELLALLVLTVTLGASRGSPERGWAGAFALLSIPLFVFHCTSTYSDAVLAMRVGGGLLFALEYARTKDWRDAARALLLLGLAALVKREGVLVAAAPAAVLLAQLLLERRRGAPFPWEGAALLAAPVVLAGVGMVAAAGLAGAFPMVGLVAGKAADTLAGAGGADPGTTGKAAGFFFDEALFRSGNQGMIFWLLVAAVALRARALRRDPLGWPLLAVAALLGEVAVSSIFIVPQYTLDQGTVNRALLVASVPAALWLAEAVADAARTALAAAPAAGPPGEAAQSGSGEGATPPRRRRSRRGSRR
jgi:hypothetical protein